MAYHLIGHAMFTTNDVKKDSTYKLANFKCLEDLSATNKNTRAIVYLIFLVRKSDKAKFNIPHVFKAPNIPVHNKPRKYQELEYRMQTTELQMEFYLQLFELICCRGDIIYSVFNGTEISCTSLVRLSSIAM